MMRRSVVRCGTAREKAEEPKDGLHQGVGALLLLAGSALLFADPVLGKSLLGGGLGMLLLLVGSGLLIVPRP
jgi:hypothetical protein